MLMQLQLLLLLKLTQPKTMMTMLEKTMWMMVTVVALHFAEAKGAECMLPVVSVAEWMTFVHA